MPVPGVEDRSVAASMFRSRVGTGIRQNTYPAVDHVLGYQPYSIGEVMVM